MKDKTTGKTWIILLVDRTVLGKNAVRALGREPWTTTFDQHKARQFKSRKDAQKFLDHPVNDVPLGFGAYPAEIVLKPPVAPFMRTRLYTPFGPVRLRKGETTFLDKVGTYESPVEA